jgi:hypothetical protein
MRKKFFIREQYMGGKRYFMIYMRVLFFFDVFYERCNSEDFAKLRIKELLDGKQIRSSKA